MTENSDVVESDLLQKLKEHVTLSDAQRQGQFDKSVMGWDVWFSMSFQQTQDVEFMLV